MGARRKTIKRVIRSKVTEWINSISDKEVQRLAKRDTLVTGGAIASLLMGNAPKDFDVYFKTQETALAVAKYYVAQFQEEKGSSYSITVEVKPIRNINDEVEDRVFIKVSSAGVAGETEDDIMEREEEADPHADADHRPAGLRHDDIMREGGDGGGRFRPECHAVDAPGGGEPQQEDRNQHQAEDRNGARRG